MVIKDILSDLESHPKGTFLNVGQFNDSHFGCCEISGVSPVWEMHPDTDEFFYIIDGEFEITLLEDEAENIHVAPAGSVFVVPKGVWHKPCAPKGAKFIYHTPGESLHSNASDPRVA